MRGDVPSEAECKRATTLFNDALEPAYLYAKRKKLDQRRVQEYLSAEDLWEGFPDEWEESVIAMLVVGSVFGRPDRVAAFLRGTKEELRGDLLPMVRLWRDRPWVWAFVRVAENLGDRRLRVEPVGAPPSTWASPDDWGPLIVYSRSIAQLHDEGVDLFFIQLVDVGPVYAVNGSVIPLRGFTPTDARYFADIVANTESPAGLHARGRSDSPVALSPAMIIRDSPVATSTTRR